MNDDKKDKKMCFLKAILWLLVLFDLGIGIAAVFWPHWWISMGHLDFPDVPGAPYRQGTIEPLFIRGVGVFWLMAAYVQFLAAMKPGERPWAVNISIIFRLSGGTFELVEVVYLLPRVGFDYSGAYNILTFFVVGDYVFVAALVYLLWKLKIDWWKDRVPRMQKEGDHA